MSDEHSHQGIPPKSILFKRWKARLIICGIMLVLAIVGLVIMNIHSASYWVYSRIMAVMYALLSIWLFWYLNRGEHKVHTSTIWHQILHWVGLIIAIYITSTFVNSGVVSSIQAGLFTLTLLALTVFLAGVYTDSAFMLIGIVLGIFAIGASLVEAYLSILMIPVIVIAAILIFFLIHHEKRRGTKKIEKTQKQHGDNSNENND